MVSVKLTPERLRALRAVLGHLETAGLDLEPCYAEVTAMLREGGAQHYTAQAEDAASEAAEAQDQARMFGQGGNPAFLSVRP